MQSWYIDSYGGPESLILGERPDPICGPEDIIIAMKASAVNPLDWKIRNGALKRIRKAEFPLAMGSEVSGTVLALGEKVDRFRIGDQVFARLDKSRTGSWSEKVAVPAAFAALKPKSLSHEECAGVPLAGLTAYQCLFEHGALQAGQRVLIHAGAGGVGSLAIQLAKQAGAEVATTASAPKHEFLKSLGADITIDYRNQRFEDLLSDFDLVLDTLGEESSLRSLAILKSGSRVVSVSGPLDPQTAADMQLPWYLRFPIRLLSRKVRKAARRQGCEYRFVFMREDGEQLTKLAEMLESGTLKPLVDSIFPFAETDRAVAHAERGRASGKVIISAP